MNIYSDATDLLIRKPISLNRFESQLAQLNNILMKYSN